MSVCQVCTFTLVTLAPGQGVQGFWSPGTISLPWGNFLSCLSGTLTKVSIGIETTPSVSHNSVSELQQRSLKVLEKRSLMRLLYNDDANGWYLLTKHLPSSYNLLHRHSIWGTCINHPLHLAWNPKNLRCNSAVYLTTLCQLVIFGQF